MFAPVALGLIDGYQRWLSPRKGFTCAYRVQNGGTGCSGFAKHAILEKGVIRALPAIRQRFRDCHAAAVALSAQGADDTPQTGESAQNRKSNRTKSGWCDYWGDFGACCGGGGPGQHGGPDCSPNLKPDCTPDCCGG